MDLSRPRCQLVHVRSCCRHLVFGARHGPFDRATTPLPNLTATCTLSAAMTTVRGVAQRRELCPAVRCHISRRHTYAHRYRHASNQTPTRTPSITTTPTATACVTAYNYVAGTSTIVPGTTDIGNHDDDLVTNIALPFPFSLYDQTYNSVNLSSNGNAQFTNSDLSPQRECLYSATLGNYAISPYWADLRTDGTNEGIFTIVQGTAPNRTFYIEWRTEYYDTGGVAHFELALHEGDEGRFDLIYGQLDEGNTSTSVGVQESNDNFTSYVCDGTGGALSDGLLLQFSLPVCATPTVTPIACTLQFEEYAK